MELLLATGIGALVAAGMYLLLRPRLFSILLGTTLLSYAVNLFLLASGGVITGSAPITDRPGPGPWPDPLPQALVLTAIVISFGMTALVIVLALRAVSERGHDRVDDVPDGESG